MVFSYNWLQSFFQKRLPKPEKMAEILTMHFAEVEECYPVKYSRGEFKRVQKFSIGRGNDFILDIDIRPNRAGDCFSHIGIAREISAITGLKLKKQDIKIKEDKNLKTKDFVSVEVRDKKACPRYTARVITDVKVGPSPKWLKERLEICGLRSINNIVDITNYVMLEMGQPLHAFDSEKIENSVKKNKKIIVRFAKKGEKIITLDGEKYDLYNDVLVIADEKKPLAIAGIKGGKSAEIDLKTKTIIIESANFNPKVIRFGSKMIDLKTDASVRFEHGIDPNLTEYAINRAVYLVQKIAGGKITKGLTDVYPKKNLAKKIKLDLNYIKNLLGLKIPNTEIVNILKRLDFKAKTGSTKIDVVVPTFRIDVSLPEDLIEEIGRIYGYEKIPFVFPVAALTPPQKNLDIFWEELTKDFLKELGFTEVYNYSFISQKDAENFNYNNKELIEIENPISSDFQYLRPTLIINLLKNIDKNYKNFKEIKIFELGKVFNKTFKEKKMLSGAITGNDFYFAKGIIDSLFQKIGIANVWYDEYHPTPEMSKNSMWHPKKCAEIKLNSEEIGFLGEISQQIKIPRTIVFDIDFEKLSKLASEEQEYKPLSRYPAAIRDIAILVPFNVKVEEVLNVIYNVGGPLIRDVDLFDIYQGEELPEGKKNLAFHIIYQAEDRTLSSEEIDNLQGKIIRSLEENLEWQVRK